MKFGIITVCYNDLANLKVTVNALKACLDHKAVQFSFEHIIIDADSSDGTKEYLNKISYDYIEYKFISEADRGIYDAMNKGVMKSSADFLVFLNAGDTIHSLFSINELFESATLALNTENCAGMVFDTIAKFNRHEFLIKSRMVTKSRLRMPGVHQSMFYKRDVLLAKPFNIDLKICGDYFNFIELFNSGLNFNVVHSIFAIFPAGGASSKHPWTLFKESTNSTCKVLNISYYAIIVISLRLALSILRYQLMLYAFRIR